MGFLKNLFSSSVYKTFSKDLERLSKFDDTRRFNLAVRLSQHHKKVDLLLKIGVRSQAKQEFNKEANLAKNDRNKAMAIGAKDESDILWFCPALLESYYNCLQLDNEVEIKKLHNELGRLLESINHKFNKDVDSLINSLPTCTANVIIESNETNKDYNCKIISTTSEILSLYASNFYLGSGSYQQNLEKQALIIWLNSANREDFRAIQIPSCFYELTKNYVHHIVNENSGIIFCNQCNAVVNDIKKEVRNRYSNSITNKWTDEWQCENGHVLHIRDNIVKLNRAPIKESNTHLDEVKILANESVIELIRVNGKIECFWIVNGLTKEELEDKLTNKDAFKAFLDVIEKRIKYKDYSEDDSIEFRVTENNKEVEELSFATRAIVDNLNNVIFHWKRKE